MLVRTLIGRYAGDVVNMAEHIAHQAIARGHAIDIRTEQRVERPTQPQTRRQKRKGRRTAAGG